MKKMVLNNKIDSVIVLAGGEGKKLRPFTFTTPKALLPLFYRPVLEHLLLDLASLGFKKITVSGHPELEEKYKDLEGKMPPGVKINWVQESSTPLASLTKAWTKDEPVLVVSVAAVLGDIKNYAKVAALLDGVSGVFLSGENLTVYENENKRIPLGVFALAPNVRGLLKKGGELEALPELLAGKLRELKLGERAPLIGTNVLSDKMVEDSLSGWVKIERPHDILDAHYVILARKAAKLKGKKIASSAKVAKSVIFKGPALIEKGAVIGEDVKLGRFVWVAEGASIEHGAIIGNYSVIGPGARIKQGATFYGVIGKNSSFGRSAEFGGMIMDEVGFPHSSHMAGIIGNKTKISVGIVTGTVKLVNPPFRMYINGKAEKTHLAGVAVGDSCFIGAGALLMGGVRIGPYSIIGPGVLVQRDVPPNKMVMRKEEVFWRDVNQETTVKYDASEYTPLWYNIP